MKSVKEYLREDGTSPFGEWFNGLEADVAAKIVKAKSKLQGGIGDVKTVNDGVFEVRLDWGPGYRVYFGQDGRNLVILLAGGTKRLQQEDIDLAKVYWADYKKQKEQKGKKK
jgi:putative addiction module killer protein